jgi:hypothetical protein
MVAKARLVVAFSGISMDALRTDVLGRSAIPTGFALLFRWYPALTRWAVLCRRCAARLRLLGCAAVTRLFHFRRRAIPTGFAFLFCWYPALARWAVLCRRSAALLGFGSAPPLRGSAVPSRLCRRYAAYCGFGSVSPLWGCVAGKDSMLAYAAISAYAPISPYAVVSAYPAISAYAVVPA